MQLHDKWNLDMLIIEGNGFQRLVKENYDTAFKAIPNPPCIKADTSTQNKIVGSL